MTYFLYNKLIFFFFYLFRVTQRGAVVVRAVKRGSTWRHDAVYEPTSVAGLFVRSHPCMTCVHFRTRLLAILDEKYFSKINIVQ